MNKTEKNTRIKQHTNMIKIGNKKLKHLNELNKIKKSKNENRKSLKKKLLI